MGLLKNLSFGKKVLLIALLPFLGLMLLSTKAMFDAYARMVDSQQLRQLTEFATKASVLMHEMQNERGITAGFIGSEGEKFSGELQQQRPITDQVLQGFNSYFQQATFLHSLGSLQEVADTLQKKAQELNTLRQRTDQFKLPVDSVLRFYAQVNAALLQGVGEISHFTHDQVSAMSYASYSDFLQAKERAGIERALLANTFEQDMFAYGEYDQFQKLKYEQDTYLTNFVRLASADVREFFQQTLTTDMARSVDKFRDKAAHGAITDSSFGVTSEEWLSVATTRIDALKEVDAYIANAQQASAVTSSESALKTMVVLSIGVVLSMLSSLVIGFFVLRTITRSVSVVKNAAEHIVEGDFSTEIPSGGKDEMGELLESFKAMQQNLEETAIRDKEQSDRFSRVKFALDHLSVNVMMADEEHNIIYINKAIQKMFDNVESCIRAELPNFDARDILGKNIDVFHKNPGHQRDLLKNMSGALKSEIQVGKAHLAFHATKVVNADGQFIGTVVEWQDRTQQVGIEGDLQTIVNAAIAGDLSHRANTEGREGFFLVMAESINATLDKVSSVFNEVNETMSCLSDGDLRRKIDSEYQGLYSEVKDNINSTVSKLESIVSKIHRTSHHIDNGSKEIVLGNENLADRTEEQVANIEETATSVEELTISVQQNAKNAQHAKQLATTASKTAKDGGQVIERVIFAMDDINNSSGKIVEIISVIDEIAFQTNLLALNAAVEAARAGEQGRGFAVVADEVQRLAQRSAAAAQEIQNLIQESVEKIKVGANLVGSSGDTLTQIVQAIDGVTHVVAEISGAVQEQANGIQQVNSSIARLDDMTQKNASLAQEASSVSHSMRDSADEMKDLVKHFTLS